MINAALQYYGYSRSSHRDKITFFFERLDLGQFANKGNWCGVFMDFIAHVHELPRPKDSQVARNWQKVGKKVDEPRCGDLVIFWRESPQSWKGHVGLYVSKSPSGRVFSLGGNQGQHRNVCIASYPGDRVLGYRRLI